MFLLFFNVKKLCKCNIPFIGIAINQTFKCPNSPFLSNMFLTELLISQTIYFSLIYLLNLNFQLVKHPVALIIFSSSDLECKIESLICVSLEAITKKMKFSRVSSTDTNEVGLIYGVVHYSPI